MNLRGLALIRLAIPLAIIASLFSGMQVAGAQPNLAPGNGVPQLQHESLIPRQSAQQAQPEPLAGMPPSWVAHNPIVVVGPIVTPAVTPNVASPPFAPAEIRKAYGIDQLGTTGAGKTIAIVDAYGSPTIQADLNTFDTTYNLPAITLTIAQPGGVPSADAGWAEETTLDVEWAHAIAPGANILLVEALSDSGSDLLNAVTYANSHGATVVSMSWAGAEFSGSSTYDSYFSQPGVTYFASSGDTGAGVMWPAVSGKVIGVGGTTLSVNSDGTYRSETAWSGSGGGVSAYVSEPAYQSNYGISDPGNMRAVPDVSFDADPSSGVDIYYSGSWYQVGGTSLSAPCWAALSVLGKLNGVSWLYSQASASYSADYNDITSGSNGGYTASTGYDFVTGLGSPKAYGLLSPLTVTNLGGATNITTTSATLNGDLAATGGENPTIYIYWGPNDGGTTTGGWAKYANLGVKADGTFHTDISGLTAGTTYYYRCYAVNSAGGSWATATTSFVALSVPTMDPITEPQGQYYGSAPVLSDLGFNDTQGLDSGWYQMDSYTGTWTPLFANVSGTSWDSVNWTIPGFTSLSDGNHKIYFKASNDSGQVVGGSGEWSWQFYKDTEAPSTVTGLTSSSHIPGAWSSDNTVDVTWTAATDNLSGLAGYSTWWGSANASDPNRDLDTSKTATSATSPRLADGDTHYFHIQAQDVAGNWGNAVSIGPFFIDTAPPSGPSSVNSTTRTDIWSDNDTISVTWAAATDNLSGLAGYSILWDGSPDATPPAVENTGCNVTDNTSNTLSDGIHYFLIRAVDEAGNWSNPVHYGPFLVDTNGPVGPTNLASPGLSADGWSDNSTIAVTWSAATDNASGIDGYSIIWDSSPKTDCPPSKNVAANVTDNVSQSLADGAYYFHIRPVDKVGNWGATVDFGPLGIDTVAPSVVTNLVSSSHSAGVWSNNPAVSVNWTAAQDTGSGIGGYSILWDTSDNTEAPERMTTGNVTSASSTILPDGNNHYLHIRAVDRAGNWGPTQTAGPFCVDTHGPTGPGGLTSSNPALNAWSDNNTVGVNWAPATDNSSGLDGYSVVWDNSPTTVPSTENAAANVTDNTTGPLADGTWYFHIIAVDKVGNWGSPETIGPFGVDVNSPLLSEGSVTPASGYPSNAFTFSVKYTHPQDLPPLSVQVSVDGGAPNEMVALGTGADFMNGEMYGANVTGLSVGSHTFAFFATDNASHGAVGDIGIHSGLTVIAAPSPPTGGGGGMGGGGGGGGAPAGPGATNLTIYTNAYGFFNLAAVCKSEDGKVVLDIAHGVTAKAKDGTPLKSLKIVPMDNQPTAPDGSSLIGLAYEFTPSGASFSPGASLTIFYDPKSLPENTDLNGLQIEVLNTTNLTWEPLESTTNKTACSVTAMISHFSDYALIGKIVVPPPPPPPPAPASFTVSVVTVDPPSTLPGLTVTISANVSNTGGTSGDYDLVLKTNGVAGPTQTISLASGASTLVSFPITASAPGNYEVDINGSLASFTVNEPQPSLAPSPMETSTPPAPPRSGISEAVLIAIIVGGVLVLGIILGALLLRRRRRR